jgi:4-carboxymuconolactone decarboxylase
VARNPPGRRQPRTLLAPCASILYSRQTLRPASGSLVTFESGARTAWHTHPLGQILILTAGTGRVQPWGDPVEEIRRGDVVWIPAGQKHWHGAAPNSSMAHIAIVEQLDGKSVE